MIAVLLLSFAVTVFASLYPLAMRLRSKSENTTQATTLCQKKIEQLRAVPFSSLTYSALQSNSIIDATPTSSPFSFTTVDGLASKLPQGTGSITISTAATDAVSGAAALRRVDVTVSWGGAVQGTNSVSVSTMIADKTARKEQ